MTTQPNFLSQCCGAAPSPLTPDVSVDDLTGKCGACHNNAVFEVGFGLAADACYNCGADLDDETDSEFCDDCRGPIRR